MTKSEFLKARGNEWRKFAGKEIFTDFMSMIENESPARRTVALSPNDQLHGSPVFLGEITGHERLRALIAGLADTPATDQDVPDKFSEPEL